jgi:hypothetical protein
MHYATTARIRVVVVYGEEGHIRPVWFVRDGRCYQVTSINHVWRDKVGRETLVFFSVSDEAIPTCYATILCGTEDKSCLIGQIPSRRLRGQKEPWPPSGGYGMVVIRIPYHDTI